LTRSFKLSAAEAADYVQLRVDPRGVQSFRRAFEVAWIKNAAFYNGKYHFVQDGHHLRNPQLAPHQVLYKAEFIEGAVSTAVAKVLSNRVAFRTPPRDGTRKARDLAKVSDRLFEHLREITDWEWLQELAWTWAAVCGSSFQQVAWDALAGPMDRFYIEDRKSRKIVTGLTPEEMRASEAAGLYEDQPQGEITIHDWNPFQFHWDWRARERGLVDCRWVATKQLSDIGTLEDIWGFEKTRGIKPIDFDSEGTYFEEILSFMASGFTSPLTAYSIPKDKRRQQTIVTQLWERPARDNRWYGRHLVLAGDTVLMNGDNPYRVMEKDVPGASIPFLKYDWGIRVGSFIGKSLVEKLNSPNFQYNKSRATMTEHQNVYGHPSMFVPKNSDLPTGHMAIQPGLVYEYSPRPGVKPIEVGPVPQLSKEVAENASRALQEIRILSSDSDPDMSKLPGNIRGAPGLELMVNEKNKGLLPTAKRAIRNAERAGKLMLAMAKANYTGERVIRYIGVDQQIRVAAFRASDLEADLRVVGEPGFFQSAATERAKILEYVQAKVLDPINNPDDRIAVLKALSYSTADEAIAERLQDEENQEAEIDEVVNGFDKFMGVGPQGAQLKPQGIKPWDDDTAHIRTLRRFLKSGEARNLHPMQTQLLSQHLDEHKKRLAQAMAQRQMMMESQRGAPGQKGQASQPSNQGQGSGQR